MIYFTCYYPICARDEIRGEKMGERILGIFRRGMMSPVGILLSAIPSVVAIYANSLSASMWCMFADILIITICLFFHDDIDACLMPFLCIMATGTTMLGVFTDFFSTIKPFFPFGVVVFIAIVTHFVIYRKPFSHGRYLRPLIFSGAAILLGGLGSLSFSNYFNLTSLYYLSGLSALPILLYLIYKNRYEGESRYGDRSERFMLYMTSLGVICALTVFKVMADISSKISIYVSKEMLLISDFPFRNTICTIIIMCIPTAICLAGMKKYPLVLRGVLLALGNIFFLSLVISTSRTAMLFGAAVLAISLICYAVGAEVGARERGVFLLLLATAFSILLARYGNAMLPEIFERIQNGLFDKSESRYQMLLRSFADFRSNPVFGAGMVSDRNADVYAADGCISWYHMYFPQIWGAMGAVGCLGFGYLLLSRLSLAFTRWNGKTMGLSLSYLALLLFSQTDTGEFNPIPFAMLSVIIFVLIENEGAERELRLPKIK